MQGSVRTTADDGTHPDLRSVPSSILVVGGTGMLAPAVAALSGTGRTVLLASRHASRSRVADIRGVVPVDADWTDATTFARAVGETARSSEPVGAALVWVHLHHRNPVVLALGAILPPAAYIVRLWGSGSGRPRQDAAAAPRPDAREVRDVFLGSMPDGHGRRWLTHDEISRGSLRALTEDAPQQVIGELQP